MLRNPVVLVHGFKDNAAKLEPLARFLRCDGWDARTVTLAPSWGQVGIEVLAKQLGDWIADQFAPGQKIDLAGFSMGGLVCRFYLQRLGGLARVQRFVTISTPHNGTLMARFWPGAGCRQMRSGSEFLRDLNGDAHLLASIQFTSLWTPFDLMILPARSSCLKVGTAQMLRVLAHPLMVWQPSCLRAIATCLRQPLPDPLDPIARE